MTRRERACVYSLLALMLAMNLVFLLGHAGPTALAGVKSLFDDLGPADRVIFTGEKELVVSNAEGRMSWSDNEHGRAYSVGFADTGKIIPLLMETPQFKDEREELTTTIQAEEEEWRAKGQELEQKFADITPESPNFEEARAEYGEFQASVQQWQASANQRVNDMAMQQLERAYREVLSAVNVVADERGIDIVYRFTDVDEPLSTGISGQTMLDMRLRPLLRYPDGLNITDDVMEEMSLAAE